jgi:hypothetical protein
LLVELVLGQEQVQVLGQVRVLEPELAQVQVLGPHRQPTAQPTRPLPPPEQKSFLSFLLLNFKKTGCIRTFYLLKAVTPFANFSILWEYGISYSRACQ